MDNDKLKAWISKNIYTIVFLGVMFLITWILLILVDFDVIDK